MNAIKMDRLSADVYNCLSHNEPGVQCISYTLHPARWRERCSMVSACLSRCGLLFPGVGHDVNIPAMNLLTLIRRVFVLG